MGQPTISCLSLWTSAQRPRMTADGKTVTIAKTVEDGTVLGLRG